MAPDPILSEVRPIREESVRPVHGKPATENAGGGGGGLTAGLAGGQNWDIQRSALCISPAFRCRDGGHGTPSLAARQLRLMVCPPPYPTSPAAPIYAPVPFSFSGRVDVYADEFSQWAERRGSPNSGVLLSP